MYSVNVLKIFQPFRCENLIRLGKDNDGGYIVNSKDVAKTAKLLSFGIGTDISFEEQFTTLNDCAVDAYDQTAPSHTFFHDAKHNLYLKNVGIQELQNLLTENDTFLKCDIEGNEYQLMNTLIERSHLLSGLVIEVHSINESPNFNNLLNFISKVNLKLIHVHVNNYFYYKTEQGNLPDILELSFTSSDNILYDPSIKLPNKLDMPNNPDDLDFQLCF